KHTTGDGIVSALQVLRALAESGTTLAKAAGALTLYPQILVNVSTRKLRDPLSSPEVKRAVRQAEAGLDGGGRVLLRPSGTEPVIRVMVEGRDAAAVRRWAGVIVGAVRKAA
ncbi:MAG: phosphoglucosamine mutase, partial [Burkholderiales bacterium]